MVWLVLSAIATPLVAIYVGPLIPPGNGSAQAQGQTFSNQVMVSLLTPVLCFMVVFFAYALVEFHARRNEAALDGPPIRNNNRIQLLWLVITTTMVLFLAGFGTYELLQDGAGGGQGPNPIALPAHHQSAFPVQVIGQQWQFTYRYPTLGGMESNQLMLPENTLVGPPCDVARRGPLLLGVRARRQGRRESGHRQRRLRHDEGPDGVPRPVRRALRALARLHVQQRLGREPHDVHAVGRARAGALSLDQAVREPAAREGRSPVLATPTFLEPSRRAG